MIKIYNTLTKKVEELPKNTLIIYTCGITVYDYCHIGHARIFILFDTLIRYLHFQNIKITFIRNITDIDDKIIKKSLGTNYSIKYVADLFIKKMYLDTKKLGLFEPTFEPKATNFIYSIIKLISFLKNEKYAYCGINDDIYYNIIKNKDYGMLSRVIISKVKIGHKNFKKLNKNFDLDFTLWKTDKDFWYSPWGEGRPGWHSECAAMNLYYSKSFIDIHSGGSDLLFPHHENELAQIAPVKGLNFIKVWLHIGHVKVNEQKMSKSLNNYLLIKNILKKLNEEYLRFFFLSTHYRQEINYSFNDFKKTSNSLNKLYKVLLHLKTGGSLIESFEHKFICVLNQDFNTSGALAILFELATISRKNKDFSCLESQQALFTLKYLGNKLGLFKYTSRKFLRIDQLTKNKSVIGRLLKKRNNARYTKNWKVADKIREQLKHYGVVVSDEKLNMDSC
ncbi:MAG TPA: cysteine--tRNA ligase [Candidatus Azoamicus sp. OHIO2]